MTRVMVGLSGGVDSAVAAAILKDAGHTVAGVFIKIWQPEFLECTWKEDRISAKRVAAHLGIPFFEIDLSREYKAHVIETMLHEYTSGRTPNPDVLCNRFIKFGSLVEFAKKEGYTHTATGHYARIKETAYGHRLLRGLDMGKDQSYFLWRLTENDLANTFFPIGDFQKKEIRTIAEKFALPNAKRPDSQGLCFVGNISISDFLSRFIHTEPGQVEDTAGNVIGLHRGAALYTVGQRHGFIVQHPIAQQIPQYVLSIDVQRNVIIVSGDQKDAERSKLQLGDVSWVSGEAPEDGAPISFEVRYHQGAQSGILQVRESTVSVVPDTAQVVAPGQSVVLYADSTCLGGGVLT